jgi:hypothetical protein
MLARNNTAPSSAIAAVSAASGLKTLGVATKPIGISKAKTVRKKNIVTLLAMSS